MTTEEFLATLDRSVHDWEVSPDAMRWAPEPPPPINTREQADDLLADVFFAGGGWTVRPVDENWVNRAIRMNLISDSWTEGRLIRGRFVPTPREGNLSVGGRG